MERTPLTPAPLVYAHRGDRSRARDNTFEAFDCAVEAHADGIELDVRRSADGVLVITHDPQVGSLPPVSDMAFSDLRQQAPEVPTLSETLEHIPRSVFINVEIKNAAHEPGFDTSRSIVDETIAMIDTVGALDRVLVSSFDPGVVERARTVAPTCLTGYLISDGLSLDEGIAIARSLDADALHPPMSSLAGDSHEGVSAVHAGGLAVVVWNANTPDDVSTVVSAGVDVIITDDPAMALAGVGAT